MSRLPKPCIEKGCPRLTQGTRCDRHQLERDRELDGRRTGPHLRGGQTAKDREWAEQVLARDPVCRMCRRRKATVADHIIPIRDGGARFDLKNGQGLCRPCHSGPKQAEDRRRRSGR